MPKVEFSKASQNRSKERDARRTVRVLRKKNLPPKGKEVESPA